MRRTTCILYYNDTASKTEPIPLGMVYFHVGELIKNWEKYVQPVFQKPVESQTDEDKALIKKWTKKDWYVKYMVRKHKKFELLKKYNQRDTRNWEDSKITLKSYENMKELVKGFKQIPIGVITLHIKQEIDKAKVGLYSAFGEANIKERLQALLVTLNDIKEKERELRSNKSTRGGRLSPEDRIDLEDAIKIEKKKLEECIEMEKRNIQLLEDYEKID
jgi:hypothetical protein